MPKRKEKNLHHIIGKCNSNRANVNDKQNKIIVDKLKHEALNVLMGYCQEPQLQLEKLANEWRGDTLSDRARELVDILLSMDKNQFYKKELLKGGRAKYNKWK